MQVDKTRRRKIPWKCALSNTILDVLNARQGFVQSTSDDWQFFWVSREWMTSHFDRHRFKDGQLVCHFRNDFELTRKDCLIKNHKKAKKLAGVNSSHMDYLPASYVLPMEYHLFVEEFRKYTSDTMWIMKPVSGAQGRGIFLFKKLKDIQEWKKKGRSTDSVTQPYVVQTYVCNPYLIGGKKFDMRLYVLVTSFRPLNAWIHREGFARFSHSRYSMDSCEDAFVHLTNVAIAKAATDYDPERGLKWSLDRLTRYIAACHGQSTVRRMLDNIANIIIQSLRSVQNQIMQDNHCFELYGYDIMLDEHLKPWLLEVNASPSLTPSSKDDYELKYRVLTHMLDVLDMEKVRTGNEIDIGGFDLLLRNNEIVMSVGSPANNVLVSINADLFEPTINCRIGDFVEPVVMPS